MRWTGVQHGVHGGIAWGLMGAGHGVDRAQHGVDGVTAWG